MKSNHLDVQYNPRMDSSCLTILEFNYFHLKVSFVNTFQIYLF